MSLFWNLLSKEIVRLPKAIGKSRELKTLDSTLKKPGPTFLTLLAVVVLIISFESKPGPSSSHNLSASTSCYSSR